MVSIMVEKNWILRTSIWHKTITMTKESLKTLICYIKTYNQQSRGLPAMFPRTKLPLSNDLNKLLFQQLHLLRNA